MGDVGDVGDGGGGGGGVMEIYSMKTGNNDKS